MIAQKNFFIHNFFVFIGKNKLKSNKKGEKMIYFKICLTALLSIAELFILTKIMGRRQISQLSLFDYINGITIGSIAAEMAISSFENILKPAVAMAVYSIVAVVFSLLSNKSIVLRRFLVGKSLILMDNGQIYRNNLKKAGLDLNEFLTQCRTSGYFYLTDLQTVIIEPNGQLSFLEKASKSPATSEDVNVFKSENKICIVIVSDGKIMNKNLQSIKMSRDWLDNELTRQNITSISDVLLAYYDEGGLTVFEKVNHNGSQDYFC